VPPSGLFVERRLSEPAKSVNGFSVGSYGASGEQGTRRLVHERHKFVGKAGHGATDTDAPNIRASTDTCHPTPFADVALDNRPPTAQLDDALNIAIPFGKRSLLVMAAAIAPFMNGLGK
jgi:hypothetical protein